MDRKEFMQRALIEVGAALVKCYDENGGIIGNSWNQNGLSFNAQAIASELLDRANDLGLIED